MICSLITSIASAQGRRPQAFLLGADISALSQVEQRGAIFRDSRRPADAIAIFRNHGWNCFRLRLFVNPNGRGGAINSLGYTLALARRIRNSGATFILDIHYSDTWADPQHQIKPDAWNNLHGTALEQAVERYTSDVIAQFERAGCAPQIVQIGNEITGGMLWPDAQVAVPLSNVKVFDATVKPVQPPQPYDDDRQWNQFSGILSAAARGVRAASDGYPLIRIMIHIDCAGDWPVTRWFFDHITAARIDYDVIGQSYYPYWHGTIQNVADNLRNTADRYGKDIIIVETAYPWKNPRRWSTRKNMAWPVSPDGQRQFLLDLVTAVHQTPGDRGLGVIYWHPESIPAPPNQSQWNSGDMALFDPSGNALPALTQ